jgi:hypothetical protein
MNVKNLGYLWIVPCAEEIHIAFKFGNVTINVHPLDFSTVPSPPISGLAGEAYCIGQEVAKSIFSLHYTYLPIVPAFFVHPR